MGLHGSSFLNDRESIRMSSSSLYMFIFLQKTENWLDMEWPYSISQYCFMLRVSQLILLIGMLMVVNVCIRRFYIMCLDRLDSYLIGFTHSFPLSHINMSELIYCSRLDFERVLEVIHTWAFHDAYLITKIGVSKCKNSLLIVTESYWKLFIFCSLTTSCFIYIKKTLVYFS